MYISIIHLLTFTHSVIYAIRSFAHSISHSCNHLFVLCVLAFFFLLNPSFPCTSSSSFFLPPRPLQLGHVVLMTLVELLEYNYYEMNYPILHGLRQIQTQEPYFPADKSHFNPRPPEAFSVTRPPKGPLPGY